MLLNTAPSKPNAQIAQPPITAETLGDWEAQLPAIKTRLEREIYGGLPPNAKPDAVTRVQIIAESAFNDTARIEEWHIHDNLPLHDKLNPTAMIDKPVMLRYVLVLPKNMTEPVPVIMMENFCPNHAVIPVDGITKPTSDYFDCDPSGVMAGLFRYVFGRYITSPPVEDIMRRGYGLAVIYPSEIFPDRASALAEYRQAPVPEYPWGAIGAWAYQFDLLAKALKQNESVTETIAYGHSRYGKSALLAAAFFSSIDGVIAHQSGTGGASLSRNKAGETVAQITDSYPHWFTPTFREDNLSVDQHHLLALIAPKPILLGNAKRDVWSDPAGAFQAARAASDVYALYGSEGLKQKRLDEFDATADIAFWMRPGTHGVVEEDWPAFLDFLDAHFKE
ncbi:hypothetical protein ACJ3XI_05305 [Litorimonas sp. RW-G-Af-16]|uniref:glucuronyl esterase domain-containing protein n=1 Tax=Litorimonas sp. RW-G-Af-16 TaxID=3241168 RepID=UPI00390C4FDB